MPGVGHLIIGCAAGRLHAGPCPTIPRLVASMAGFSAVSSLADADVVAFALGIPYAATWGHRGAFHSLTMAVFIGLVAAGFARLAREPFGRTAALAVAVAASHGLLDTMTDGGHGIAILWPLTDERLFAPWRPIPVSPIGPGLLSMRGAAVAAAEVLMLLPLALYAWLPRWWRRDADQGVSAG